MAENITCTLTKVKQTLCNLIHFLQPFFIFPCKKKILLAFRRLCKKKQGLLIRLADLVFCGLLALPAQVLIELCELQAPVRWL